MDFEEYNKKRIQDQIDYFDRKSVKYKKIYFTLKTTQILISASIPVLTSFVIKHNWVLILISIAGALVTAIDSIISLNKFNDKRIQYRASSELLKQEQYLYETKSEIYSNDPENSFNLLVSKIESILSNEVSEWSVMAQKNKR